MTTVIGDCRGEPRLYFDSATSSFGVSFELTKVSCIVPSSADLQQEAAIIGWSGSHNEGTRFAYHLRQLYKTDSEKFRELLTDPGGLPKFIFADEESGKDLSALLIYRDWRGSAKLYQLYEDMVPIPLTRGYHAIGSGSHYALGALAQGSGPAEALGIAAEFDSYTGCPFKAIDLRGNIEVLS